MHRSYGIKDRIRERKRRLRMQLRLNKLDRELEAIAARQKQAEERKFRNLVLEEAAEVARRSAEVWQAVRDIRALKEDL